MVLEDTRVIAVDTKTNYEVPVSLEFLRKVGSGAYGVVASFKYPSSGEKVAVKKITNAFDDLIDAKRILREIKILRQLSHENIIRILDIFPPAVRFFVCVRVV